MRLSTLLRVNEDLTQDLIDNLTDPFIAVKISFDKIRYLVSLHTGVKPELINANTRKTEIKEARQLCHYFAVNKQLASLSKIGEEFGNKDHATVIHSHKTITNLAEFDKVLQEKINSIEKLLK